MEISHIKSITMQQLEALVRVAEERSFSRAAIKMFLSQPSLSKHIKNLENLAGTPLINRSASGISLTDEGRILYSYSKKILRLRDEAGEKVLQTMKSLGGDISVGASTIPSTYILPRLIRGMKDNSPDIRVHITTGDSEEIVQTTLNSEVDIGFIGMGIKNSRLSIEQVWNDRLVLIAPASHHWHMRDMVDPSELVREPYINRKRGSATRTIVEEFTRKQNLPPLSRFNISCEMGSSEAVKEAVIAGLGVSIISVLAVRRELESGLLVSIPINAPTISRPFNMIYRSGYTPPPHVRVFMEYTRIFEI